MKSICRVQTIINDSINKTIIISIVVFSAIAHLYRYTNMAFNSDSLGVYRNNIDFVRQVSRGRWLQPLYLLFRGRISAPYLIGFLATCYLIIAVIFIVKILCLKKQILIILLCGMISTWSMITCTNAAFIHDTDMYLMGILFSIAGAWICLHYKYGWLVSIVLFAFSMAIYQCNIESGVLLSVFFLLRECICNEDIKLILRRAVKVMISVLISFAVYYIIWIILLKLMNLSPETAGNSVNNATIFRGNVDFLTLFKGTYSNVLDYFIHPETFRPAFSAVYNIILSFLAAASLVLIIRKIKRVNAVIALVLSILLLFTADFTYVLSGTFTSTNTFAIVLLYGAGMMIFERCLPDLKKKASGLWLKALKTVCIVCILSYSLLIFNNIVFSNQVYLKKDLEYQNTLSLMTRVLSYMENVDGYYPGETTVVFEGALEKSSAVDPRPGYEDIAGRTFDEDLSVTYYRTYYFYCLHILGYPLNISDKKLSDELRNNPEVISMPAFPKRECCKMIDGVMVVKLSDDMSIR